MSQPQPYPDGHGNMVEGVFAGYTHYADISGFNNTLHEKLTAIVGAVKAAGPTLRAERKLEALDFIVKRVEEMRSIMAHYGNRSSGGRSLENEYWQIVHIYDAYLSRNSSPEMSALHAAIEDTQEIVSELVQVWQDDSRCKHCGVLGGH